MACWLAGSPDDSLAQLSCEAWPALPAGLGGKWWLGCLFSAKGKLDVYPLLPQEAPVAAAVLTGLLAFLLGWLAALEGRLCTDQPEGRGTAESPAITNPRGPSHPQPILRLDGKQPLQEQSWGRPALLEVAEGDAAAGGEGALLQGPCTSLARRLTSVTSVTHWPRLFNISWPLEPAPCPSLQAPFVCQLPPPRGGASMSLDCCVTDPEAASGFRQPALTLSLSLLTCLPRTPACHSLRLWHVLSRLSHL